MTISQSMSIPAEQLRDMYAQVGSDIRTDLAAQGLRIPDDPNVDRPTDYFGDLPTNLDMLTNDDLAALMVRHQAWTRFVNGSHSDATAQKTVSDRIRKGVRAAITNERGKEYVDTDPRYVEADCAYLYYELKSEIIAEMLRDARNGYQIISRLITLREQDLQQTTRRGTLEGGSNFRNRRSLTP